MSKKRNRARAADEARPAAQTGNFAAPAERLDRALAVGEPLSIALLFAYLLWKTWMRWPDALVDFPRSLYTAWRLSEGAALYVDVLSWYGPMPHLFEGAAFKMFGPGLDTLVWLNVGVTIVCLLLVRAIFGALGGRLVAWLCSVVFLVVFVFGQFVQVSNYNFITPYASQATYGFAGLLLTLWALLRQPATGKSKWLWVAGAGVGVTFLNKPEPLLAASGAAGIFLVLMFLQIGHAPMPNGGWRVAGRWIVRSVVGMAGGFFCVWLAVFTVLVTKGGPAYAWRYTNWVPHTLLTQSFLKTGIASEYGAQTLGLNAASQNFMLQLEAGGWLLLVCGIILFAAWFWARAPKNQSQWWSALALAAGTAVIAGSRVAWLTSHPTVAAPGELLAWHFTWIEIGKAVIFPVLLVVLLAVMRCLWSAWRQRTDFAAALSLAVVGSAAALMLARMILNGRIYHYGFVMAPLAVFFLLHLLVGEAPRRLAGRARYNWLLPAVFVPLVLVGVVQLRAESAKFYALKTLAVGEGRDRFYAFPQEVLGNGAMLNTMLREVRARTPAARTLLALPESSALNYHLRLPVPLAEIDFLPTTLDFLGREQMLADLRAHPPDIIILYDRDLQEYGVPHFAADEASGQAVARWVVDNYDRHFAMSLERGKAHSVTGELFDIFTRKGWSPAPQP